MVYKIAYSSSHTCFICRRKHRTKKLKMVSKDSICQVFKKSRILITLGSRCCISHLDDKSNLRPEIIESIDKSIPVSFTTDTLSRRQSLLLEMMADYYEKPINQGTSSENEDLLELFYDSDSIMSNINDNMCLEITGLTVEQFILVNQTAVRSFYLRNSPSRSTYQCLAIYFFWLKTNMSQKRIGYFFRKNKPISQQTVSEYLNSARVALNKSFVPESMGSKQLTRETLLTHLTPTVKELFGLKEDQAVFIADGTYLYCEKSFDNFFQYQTYSSQLKCHLIKVFIICCPDGYIIDCYPSFPATSNDASIIVKILQSQPEMVQLIRPGDLILLDRGFRDAVSTLTKTYNLAVRMPLSINDDDDSDSTRADQLSQKDANRTRFVTKCRYIIESINGLLKQSFKALSSVQNTLLSHIGVDYLIAASLINRFYQRRFSDGAYAEQIANSMKSIFLEKSSNDFKELKAFLKQRLKPSEFQVASDENILDFPRMTLTEIITNITFGSYQVKMSKSYLPSIMGGIIRVKNSEDSKIVACYEIKSRHMSRKQYYSFVKYSVAGIQGKLKKAGK